MRASKRVAVGDLIISRRNGASIDVWHPTDEDKSVDLVRNGSPNALATAHASCSKATTYDSRSVCVRSGQLWRAASWVSCTRECTPSLV